jgi:ParB-like chromosome segregation protein Spo0J
MEKRLFFAACCEELWMSNYTWGPTDGLPLGEIDLDYRRYRLANRQAEEAMAASLRRHGQLSPVVVCETEGRLLLLDGFKRHAAAGQVKGMHTLWSRRLQVDAATAKAAIYTLNAVARQVQALEEAWIVHALVRGDGLSQPAVAELLGRHKSWVCRRLALLEKLAPEAREDLGLGLISPTMARQLTRLPAGNQAETVAAARRESLTGGELRGVVELLLASGTREKRQYVLEKPRQALREVEGHLSRSWDPRMSAAGNHISRRLARLLELLGSLQAWLRYNGRGTLELRDRQPLRPGFERLLSESRGVAELTVDFLEELHLP